MLEAASNPQGNGWMTMVMLVLIFVVMWLFMIRPQRKQQKELQEFRNSLKKGDKIVTAGGIYGTVVEVKENNLLVEIDKDVKIRIAKSSVVKDYDAAAQQ